MLVSVEILLWCCGAAGVIVIGQILSHAIQIIRYPTRPPVQLKTGVDMEDKMKIIHGYSGEYDPRTTTRPYSGSYKTFSLGIFPILPKASGKGTKHGTVVVRVSGPVNKPEAVTYEAQRIIKLLDAGEYKGQKRVRVK